MKLADVEKIMAQPDYANRVAVLVLKDGDEYVAEWEGVEYRASNPFGLDSRLAEVGAPGPRNLFLMDAGEAV